MDTLNIMLWESEKEINRLKKELEEKDRIIDDLKTEIKMSDLEVKDLSDIVNKSRSVIYMNKLCDKIHELSRINKELTDIYNTTANIFDYEFSM